MSKTLGTVYGVELVVGTESYFSNSLYRSAVELTATNLATGAKVSIDVPKDNVGGLETIFSNYPSDADKAKYLFRSLIDGSKSSMQMVNLVVDSASSPITKHSLRNRADRYALRQLRENLPELFPEQCMPLAKQLVANSNLGELYTLRFALREVRVQEDAENEVGLREAANKVLLILAENMGETGLALAQKLVTTLEPDQLEYIDEATKIVLRNDGKAQAPATPFYEEAASQSQDYRTDVKIAAKSDGTTTDAKPNEGSRAYDRVAIRLDDAGVGCQP